MTDPLNPIDPEARNYSYDPIVNRNDITECTISSDYTINNLNQYDSVEFGADTKSITYVMSPISSVFNSYI